MTSDRNHREGETLSKRWLMVAGSVRLRTVIRDDSWRTAPDLRCVETVRCPSPYRHAATIDYGVLGMGRSRSLRLRARPTDGPLVAHSCRRSVVEFDSEECPWPFDPLSVRLPRSWKWKRKRPPTAESDTPASAAITAAGAVLRAQGAERRTDRTQRDVHVEEWTGQRDPIG